MSIIKSPFQTGFKIKKEKNPLEALQQIIELSNELKAMRNQYQSTMQEHSDSLQAKYKELDAEIARLRKLQIQLQGDVGPQGPVGPAGENGKDGVTPVVDTLEIAKAAAKMVKVPEVKIPETKVPEIDHEKIAEEVMNLFEKGKKKLSVKHLGDFTDGMEQYLRPIRSLALGARGGGDVVTAGSNITITTDANGVKSIASTSSATIYSETPTGAINGSNKVYTVAHTMTTVIGFWINGQFIHPSEYTAVGTTITFVTALDSSLSGTGFTISYT